MWVITYLVAESRRDFDHGEFRMDRVALVLRDCRFDSIVMLLLNVMMMMMIVVKRIWQMMYKKLFYSIYVDMMIASKLHEASSFRYG